MGTFLHVAHFLKLSLNFEGQNAKGTRIRVLRNIIMQISQKTIYTLVTVSVQKMLIKMPNLPHTWGKLGTRLG